MKLVDLATVTRFFGELVAGEISTPFKGLIGAEPKDCIT